MSDTFIATERLWDPENETLAYRAGEQVPESQRSLLVPESDWAKRRNVIDYTDPRGYSRDPATVAKMRVAAPRSAASRKATKKVPAKKAAKKTTRKPRGA